MMTAMRAKSHHPERRSHTMSRKRRADQYRERYGDLLRFRCHVGHAFSAESLMADQSEELENALWAALRSLEENAALARRMAARAGARNHTVSVMQFEENARRVEQHAEVLRQVLHNSEKAPVDDR